MIFGKRLLAICELRFRWAVQDMGDPSGGLELGGLITNPRGIKLISLNVAILFVLRNHLIYLRMIREYLTNP